MLRRRRVALGLHLGRVVFHELARDGAGGETPVGNLGHRRHLKRILDQAFSDASRCSSDPLCAGHIPSAPSDALHGAACHACLFASETSCENNNKWLERSVLVDLTGDGLAFPS